MVYGPVPSRRLGRSLGVNHVPPKTCSYSCVYCQLGRTDNMTCKRKQFYEPEYVVNQIKTKLATETGDIDYVTFVPDGEPTLDLNLGVEINAVKQMNMRTAVICNSSLLWMDEVRNDLMNADWVSVKVDAFSEKMWRMVDRPHGELKHSIVQQGIRDFSKEYKGILATETMLVKGMNDTTEPRRVAEFLSELKPDVSYVAIQTRPPADKWVKPAEEKEINSAYQAFSEKLPRVEYLIGYEGNAFASTGDFESDILSITSVHPMREDAVRNLLKNDDAEWGQLELLISENKIVELEYNNRLFYMRKISSRITE